MHVGNEERAGTAIRQHRHASDDAPSNRKPRAMLWRSLASRAHGAHGAQGEQGAQKPRQWAQPS